MSFPTSKLEADGVFDTVNFESLKNRFDDVVAPNLAALALQTFTGSIGTFTVTDFIGAPAVLAFTINHPGAKTNQLVIAFLEVVGGFPFFNHVHLQTATVSTNGSILFNIKNNGVFASVYTFKIHYIIVSP